MVTGEELFLPCFILFNQRASGFSIPEEWLALGLIEGEQYPCPGLAFIPKEDSKPRKGGNDDIIQMLNNLYEVGKRVQDITRTYLLHILTVM